MTVIRLGSLKYFSELGLGKPRKSYVATTWNAAGPNIIDINNQYSFENKLIKVGLILL